jgi:putative transposase
VKLRKVFRFRMDPTPEQRESLARMAGARRFVWNWALNQRKQHYATTGKGLPSAELSRGLTALKQQPALAWLKEADSQALQQVLADLHALIRTSSRSGRASHASRAASGTRRDSVFRSASRWLTSE